MKIFFVGIHNKPNKTALDSTTKSGKLIDRVILHLKKQNCIKTNLFNLNQIPKKINQHQEKWIKKYSPSSKDLIFLLGKEVQNLFPKKILCKNIIPLPHPSSIWSKKSQEKYIQHILSFT